MPAVSVIVPVYNIKTLLPRCVASLQAQTWQDFEVWLVDDGSTDGSGELCDEYAAEDARIHALHGVDILCCPAAVSGPVPEKLAETRTWHKKVEPYGYSNTWWHLWRVRGGENNCYVAFANAVGQLPDGRVCFGRSGVFQPMIWLYHRNEVVLSATAEDRACILADTTGDTRTKYLLPMRRTIWYDPLVMLDQ